jgi:hypothetical protein
VLTLHTIPVEALALRERYTTASVELAFHESGHGMIQALLGRPCSRIRIDTTTCTGSMVPPSIADMSIEHRIVVSLSGPIAAALVSDEKEKDRSLSKANHAPGCHKWRGDHANILADLAAIPGSTKHRRRVFRKCLRTANEMVRLWWPTISFVAEMLLIHTELTGGDIEAAIENRMEVSDNGTLRRFEERTGGART